jgi:hypothetical protein
MTSPQKTDSQQEGIISQGREISKGFESIIPEAMRILAAVTAYY